MTRPRGIGSGKGRGLAGLTIVLMAKVWLTWVLVALSLPGGDFGIGRVRELGVLDFGPCPPVAVALLGGILSGGGSAPLGARGKAELPGRGLVEFARCGKVLNLCGKDMVNIRCLQGNVCRGLSNTAYMTLRCGRYLR
jgi:hypothetical protein